MKFKLLLIGLAFMLPFNLKARQTLFYPGGIASIAIHPDEQQVVNTAANILKKDMLAVLDCRLSVVTPNNTYQIIAGTIGVNKAVDKIIIDNNINISEVEGTWEGFLIKRIRTNGKDQILIAGNDSRGTAYGILEISRMLGVSPWEWWADSLPKKLKSFTLGPKTIIQSPSVQYRGIFLNDEDWGLLPWASENLEPNSPLTANVNPVSMRGKKVIGPNAYGRVFELLLRLRANTIWPAMHEVTVPFYFAKGNKEEADKYGIIVGTSHCEPMMRNSASEWDAVGKGRYNYVTNKEAILNYWIDRSKELVGSENFFTVGMRGKHDGKMEGVNTVQEYKNQLARILPDQQQIIQKYINRDYKTVPQAFVPYKEVLDVYNSGLQVPDHITLVWPDDNFGYLRHFPDSIERERPGGNGVYYHLSYWGRPHDYLWLGTTNPALIVQQMILAFHKGAKKLWIANVGDIKPSEYQMELFLDLAWNINDIKNTSQHLQNFLKREFGNSNANSLAEILNEHYRLAQIRKPELLGNSRVYDDARSQVTDLPWSAQYIKSRLKDYKNLSEKVEKVSSSISKDRRNTFFELVGYPVQAASQMNLKMLNGQLARNGLAPWDIVDVAYDSIQNLTKTYNSLSDGKWNGIMDSQPRKLPVFEPLKHQTLTASTLPEKTPDWKWNGSEGTTPKAALINGLGYEGKAASIAKNTRSTFVIKQCDADSIEVEVRLIPTHPVEGGKLRFALSLDNGDQKIEHYQTQESSEEWKDNIVRNLAIRRFKFATTGSMHKIHFYALDEGVLLDQIYVYKHQTKL